MPTIVRVKAFETDTVEIAWGLKDGTWFVQRVTIPPKSTREVRSLDVVGQPLERGGKATTEVVQPQKGSHG